MLETWWEARVMVVSQFHERQLEDQGASAKVQIEKIMYTNSV